MPNVDHLAILKQGLEGWNKWRMDNSHILPDLGRANLLEADLSREDLSGAILTTVYLESVQFIAANLRWADLTGANLRRADLRAYRWQSSCRGLYQTPEAA